MPLIRANLPDEAELDFNVNEEARSIRSVILERFGGAILDHRAEELLP